ncbi:MAG: glycosyltransferase [Candidatus Altiarchaeales archaeon]|nr:glycosyltransferase [Candidatus Altiarchaeales archaeon]MBD3416128.1 glycosyltransferase [Candidatus Altiarchaeales archaeon]
MELSVVVPALNEEDGVGETVEEVRAALAGVTHEIVVVDDGSSDRTGEVAESAGARIIRHETNRGYGAAIKTGVENSSYGVICLLDADHTYPPAAIPKLLGEFKGDGCIVSGSRFLGVNAGMPFIRKLGNTFFIYLTSILLMKRVYDVSSGMKVFSKTTFDELQPLPDTLDMMIVITIRSHKRGYLFREVPIGYDDRKGASKLSAFREGVRFLTTIVRTSILG